MEPSRQPDATRLPAPDQEIAGQYRQAQAPPRPAWVEISLAQLRRNLALIRAALPAKVGWLAVVKDDAYGHGLVRVAREALSFGAGFLGVTTLAEGVTLRDAGIAAPILLLGERHPDELPFCLEYRLRVSLGDLNQARLLDRLAQKAGLCVPVHLKINTGMNRYGLDAGSAVRDMREISTLAGLIVEGVMSHFSMSDEADKTFALEQLQRFNAVLAELDRLGVKPGWRHLCNTGGFLDLPQAHFDLVRLGILPTGVYPSATCRRLEGLSPIMQVKARLVTIRQLQPGEVYGYGLRYRATEPRRIGVIPMGYGDGYPRLRNTGHALVHGKLAPLIGGVAMDALGLDLTDIPEARLWDEVVLMGEQGKHSVSARDIAAWGQTVCYDILAGWRHRLPRIEMGITS